MTELKDDRRFHNLTQEQVETLDQVLTEVIPIHGRGNFPTLEVKPKDIICIVRDRLISKSIKVRDVRLNGSTASHVLVKENGTSYKDLDIIFGVELPKQEDFQIIKEVVLSCLLDFLPRGVNKDKITALTMKEAYVQKMVKVFTEHDRWSLISLSNNSGKNVELKFVSSLRRQFEFSVDSFQIILDPMLESYLEAERRETAQHDKKEKDSSLIQSSDSQSGIINQLSTSTITEIRNETDVDMPSETMDMPVLPDYVCNSETVVIEDQCKPPTKETSIESTQIEDNSEMAESITMLEAVEEISELSKISVVHVEKKDEMNENGHMLQDEVNSNGDNNDSQVEKEQVAIVERKNNDISDEKLSASQESVRTEGFTETENMSAVGSGNDEPAPKMELEMMTCEPMQISEKTPAPMVLNEKCTFQPPPVTFLTQTVVDSYNEYPLPPPAKKNSRSSQMVVLKHSSPKPPRKMSRKVTCMPHLAEKSKDSTSKPCQLLSQSPNGKDLKESMPMQTEMPGLTTNCLESLSVVSLDKEPPCRILDKPSVVAQENGTHSEGELIACLSTNESVQTQVQISEPETGETTNCPIVSPLSKPFNAQMDESIKIQPLSEKVEKTYSQTVKPIIQVNSQPIIQVDDSPVLTAISPVKEEAELAAQTAECTQEYSKSPETGNQTLDSSSMLVTSPSTKLAIDSEEVESAQVLGHPATSSKVPEPPISCLQPQEPTAPCAQALESPVVTSQLLEPPIFVPHIQDSALTDFPKPPEISSCLLEPPTSSEKQELSLWPSPVLESSTLSLERSESSGESLHVLEPPEVLPQIVEPSLESPSRVLQSTVPPESVSPLETSQGPNPSDSEESLPPPRQVPSVTVVAESMYGDFEQAMDHLRYRLIATRNPEEIRGGGLLKYSNLLVRDFKPASETEIKTLERYMCSRFFIDFPDVNEQQRKIESYLRNHFIGEEKSKYDYLMTLRRVVNESTVCLMGHERRQTLNMITILALKVLGEQNIIPNTNNVTCYYQPAPYMADHNFSNYYIANGQSPLIYHPYPLHIHMQTGLV